MTRPIGHSVLPAAVGVCPPAASSCAAASGKLCRSLFPFDTPPLQRHTAGVAKKKAQKRRVAFRKNRGRRPRPQNLTRDAQDEGAAEGLERDGIGSDQRLSGKGSVTRHRTVLADDAGEIAIDEAACVRGRVLRAIGSTRCRVRLDGGEGEEGRTLECSVRRVVRTMERETRNAVVAGDLVQVRPEETDGEDTDGDGEQRGVIERVEPRTSALSRTSGRYAHLIVANVDQVVIVGSAAQPDLKTNLVDRFIVAAEKGGIRPVVCVNKADLADRNDLIRVTGVYGQLGYQTVLTSAETGEGVDELRDVLRGQETVFAGQSGVGKTSLLNAVQPGLALRTAEVAEDSGKGRHTTRVAELRPLEESTPEGRRTIGWVVDTPGVRQMDLWGVEPGEVEGYFREFRPLVPQCRFPDCTHTHEDECGIKRAVELGMVSEARYHGYVRILTGECERGEH